MVSFQTRASLIYCSRDQLIYHREAPDSNTLPGLQSQTQEKKGGSFLLDLVLIFCMDTIHWVSKNLEHVEGTRTDFVLYCYVGK